MPKLLISVIICTHNRADYVVKALESLVQQSLGQEFFEVILVDNASTDNTKKLVGNFSIIFPAFHYIYEPVLGLSSARNTGLTQATSPILAYLDDDAIADPGWLESAVNFFEHHTTKVGLLGGKVSPIWELPRPAWLEDNFLPYYSVIDYNPEITQINNENGFVGANMVFSKQALQHVGGFSVQLGRKGNNLLSNEELQLKSKLEKLGYDSFYNPGMAVKHHIIKERINKKWILKRMYWQGRSDAALYLLNENIVFKMKVCIFLSHVLSTLRVSIHLFYNTLFAKKRHFSLANQGQQRYHFGYSLQLIKVFF